MADFNISITVTGSIGGQSFSWSRTATVANIDDAVYGLSQYAASVGDTETTAQSSDGLYSYSGAAVIVQVHTSPGAIANFGVTCTDSGQRARWLAAAFVPVIYYNGAGTGFTGGVNASDSATDTPTIDIVGSHYEGFIGTPSNAALIGLKAIS
jgi:hypothetical protein